MRRAIRFLPGLATILVGSLMAPASVAALPYDGTNPAATVCGDGSHQVVDLATKTIYNDDAVPIGKVYLRHSRYCATVWSRVCNLTTSSRSFKEQIILVTAGPFQAALEGGSFGTCVTYTVDTAPDLTTDQAYVMFLSDGRNADDSPRRDRPVVFAAWPVAADETVATAEDGEMPVADLVGELQAAR